MCVGCSIAVLYKILRFKIIICFFSDRNIYAALYNNFPKAAVK